MSITVDKMLAFLAFMTCVAQIWIAVRFLFHGTFVRFWVWYVGIAGMLLCVLSDVLYSRELVISSCSAVFICSSYFLTVKRPAGQHWSWSIRKYLFLKYQWIIVFEMVTFIFYPLQQRWMKKELFYLISDTTYLIWIIFLCASYQWNRNMKFVEKYEKKLKRLLMPFFLLLLFEMIFVSDQYYKTQLDYGNGFQKNLAYVVSIIFVCSYSIFSLILLDIQKMNQKMQQMMFTEKQMSEQQILYYEALLKKEEETRKYRHDMSAHIMLLDSMAEEGDIEGIRSYLSGMIEHMEKIRKSVFTTGIRALDGILNYYFTELDTEAVRVAISGKCAVVLEISEMDFCTIFSNLIRNMVEAVSRSASEKQFINIRITEGIYFVQILMENSVEDKKILFDEKGNPETDKEDKENHGFGIENARKVVEKSGGKFECFVKDGVFICRVILKKKKEPES